MNPTRSWIAFMIIAAFAACAKLDLGGDPLPTPTPAPTSSATPTVCGTPAPGANVVTVAMGNNIGAASAPTYGTINGYAVLLGPSVPGHAALISQWLSQGVVSPITSDNVLQFTNVDSAGTPHSAVGFTGNAFPPPSYTFPSAAASPTATAVSTTKLWSTGRVAAPPSGQCYSQTFALTPGVYYFGDLDYYSLSNFRDVLVVATASPLTAMRAKTVMARHQ